MSHLSATALVAGDPWLKPFESQLCARDSALATLRKKMLPAESLKDFALAHQYFGLHRSLTDDWIFRERLPNATRVYLLGDFNGWQETRDFRLHPNEHGEWEGKFHRSSLSHGQHYKLRVYWEDNGKERSGERIPPHARRVVQDPSTLLFSAQVWAPANPYTWQLPSFSPTRDPLLIYESHVGMSSEEGKVATYVEFRDSILPRIKGAGYNTVQLMAIQEHPYYGSFGYQVSNFFAPSSRSGTPEELKSLIDEAHRLGLSVIMDLVHSHAVKNEVEGLGVVDGSDFLYCHTGSRGEHPAWNTRLFDYGKTETLHFLLSNCRYWLEEFKFDGFRFDGITSMLYWDHGLGRSFDSYDRYFDGNLDLDAYAYLTLANELIHSIRPDAITIAEDMSGLPGLAAKPEVGGCGFDFRLSMGVPDFWIRTIKEKQDQDWNVSEIFHELTNHRSDEQVVSYCESHDQALVGDKTIMFRLADQEMYWSMQRSTSTPTIERAIALHKIIRFLTATTAGHGYLNFMGNEFGHPEWIDFPREGNDWSYHYARRQWSLVDNTELRYSDLARFDSALMRLITEKSIYSHVLTEKVYEQVSHQVVGYTRGDLLFAVNLNPSQSYTDVQIRVSKERYRIALCTDQEEFGGHGRVDTGMLYPARGNLIQLYLPARTAIALAPA